MIEKWGENKLILEEATTAALLAAAAALLIALALLPAIALRGVIAYFGALDDPAALGWALDHRVLLALALSLGVGGAGLAAALAFRIFGWQRSVWVFSGGEYLADAEEASDALSAREAALASAAQRAAQRANQSAPRGVRIGPIELSRTRETGHIALYGLPGSGKTTVLRAVIAQAIKRGDRILAHDPKGEFADALAPVGNPDAAVLLGPWDARARPWDIAADITTPALADGFGTGLFPPGQAGPNQYFVDAARAVFAALVKSLQARRAAWGWADLARLLEAGPAQIAEAAWAGDPLTRTLLPDPTARAAQSILSEVARAAGWVPGYARAFAPGAKPFALRRWLLGDDPTRVVLLNADRRYAERGEQLFGAMLAAVAASIASPAMAERDADAPGALWIIADEFPQLGLAAQTGLLTIEEMGRSRGVRVIKAMQDPSQLLALAGRDKGEVMRSMQQTRIFAKLSATAAAHFARDFGDNEIRRVEFPHIVGGGNKRIVADRGPIIRPDDLTGLRVLPGVGVELVLAIDDLLGKVIQPFTAFPSGAGAQIPNPRWDAVAASALIGQPIDGDGDGITRAMMPSQDADLPFPVSPDTPADALGNVELREDSAHAADPDYFEE